MAHTERINGQLVLRDDWHVADIQERKPGLTDKQAEEILELLAKNHNAEVGYNYDVIDIWIDRWIEDSGITPKYAILNAVQNEWWRDPKAPSDSDKVHVFDTEEEADDYLEAEAEKMDLSDEEGEVFEYYGS